MAHILNKGNRRIDVISHVLKTAKQNEIIEKEQI